MEEPGGVQSMELQRVRHDRATKHSTAQHTLSEDFSDSHYLIRDSTWTLIIITLELSVSVSSTGPLVISSLGPQPDVCYLPADVC